MSKTIEIDIEEAESEVPVLVVEISGEVSKSNFPEFRSALEKRIAMIDTAPATTDELESAQANVNGMKKLEQAIQLAKNAALAQAESIYEELQKFEVCGEIVRQPRLKLEKAIASLKETKKKELIDAALATLTGIGATAARRAFLPAFETSIKGRSAFPAMESALADCAANIQANLDANETALAEFEKANGSALIADRDALMILDKEKVETTLANRLAVETQKQIAREAEKARREAEAEAAKLKAEAAAAAAKQSTPAPSAAPVVDPPFLTRQQPAASQADPSTDTSAAEEMQQIMAEVGKCFAQLKPVRAGIKHQANADKMAKFANAVAAAWIEFKA